MSRLATAAPAKPSLRARLRHLMACLAFLVIFPNLASAAPLLGANLDPTLLPPDRQTAELARLAESGVSSIRFLLDWNRVEPEPGRFTWQAYDAAVDAALAQGLDVVLILGPCAEWAVNPAWQVPLDQRRYSLPRSLDLWEQYVRRAVSHFRGRVKHWQVRRHPTARNFRGERREYLRLLQAAALQIRAADPNSFIILPEAGALDIAALDRVIQSEDAKSCSILGLYFPTAAQSLSRTALAWAAITHEVIGQLDPSSRRPLWVLGADDELSADCWLANYLLAWAFGAERCYLPPESISHEWTRELAQLRYLGFLRLGPEIWALAFEGPQGIEVIAWCSQQTDLAPSLLAPVAAPDLLEQAALLGGIPGSALAPQSPQLALRLGLRPALIQGLAPDLSSRLGPPTRSALLASRVGPGLAGLPLVYADYSATYHPEFGLYNRPLRELRGGDVTEETHTGLTCLGTRMTYRTGEEEMDNPWIYFDVDDDWLYFARGRTRVAVTVICEGSPLGEEKLGFNILYDATGGYRFTDWQWAGPGYQWYAYCFELDNVNFANRGGYDFRINAKGSKHDLWVAAVLIEKLPPPTSALPPEGISPQSILAPAE